MNHAATNDAKKMDWWNDMTVTSQVVLILAVILLVMFFAKKMEDRWYSYPDVVWKRIEEIIQNASAEALAASKTTDPTLALTRASRAIGMLHAVNQFDSIQQIDRHVKLKGGDFNDTRLKILDVEKRTSQFVSDLLPTIMSSRDLALQKQSLA